MTDACVECQPKSLSSRQTKNNRGQLSNLVHLFHCDDHISFGDMLVRPWHATLIGFEFVRQPGHILT